MKPIAWYDPSNGMVSTDQDCPLFTPLGQVWGLYAKEEAKDEPVAWKWHQAPVKTQWGDDMVVADIAIDKDNTVSVYCERDQTAKVKAMFTIPQRTPITDEDIRQANHHMVCGAYDYSFKQGVRWAEKVHGIKWEWEV
jgi:hypothetical protein